MIGAFNQQMFVNEGTHIIIPAVCYTSSTSVIQVMDKRKYEKMRMWKTSDGTMADVTSIRCRDNADTCPFPSLIWAVGNETMK